MRFLSGFHYFCSSHSPCASSVGQLTRTCMDS